MTATTQFVMITPKAAEEVKKLVAAEDKPGIGLRLGVKGGGCSGPGRIWKDVKISQAHVADGGQRVFEHGVGFGGKAGDQVGAEHDLGPGRARAFTEIDRAGAAVAALHAFEHDVAAGLYGKVQVRHQAFVLGKNVE